MADQASSDWIEHTTGEMPVEGRTLVKIRSAFEFCFDDGQMPRRAAAIDWVGQGDLSDITHFQVAA